MNIKNIKTNTAQPIHNIVNFTVGDEGAVKRIELDLLEEDAFAQKRADEDNYIPTDYIQKDETDFNKRVEAERKEQEEVLPLDMVKKIITNEGLMTGLTDEQKLDKIIRSINLYDIIKDCLQSSLNSFCEAYNKKNPNDNLGLKLILRPLKKKSLPYACKLVIEQRKVGLYKVIHEQEIGFVHVSQLQDEAGWKYALYAAMFNSIVSIGISTIMINQENETK